MPLRKEYPVYFTAKGLSDAFDSTQTFRGACTSLQNLIFDPANPELLTSRPGVGTPLTTFSTFTDPTGISVFRVIGNMAYGLVSTNHFTGKDEPFAFNLSTNTFISVANTLAANLPGTQSTTGDWVPPTIDMVGTRLVFTHPGFTGATQTGHFSGSITGSILTVTNAGTAGSNGALHSGANLANGIGASGILPGTSIIAFVTGSGTEGGTGNYVLNTTYPAPLGIQDIVATSQSYFGILDVSAPTNPTWYSTNTGVFGLPSVPHSVANFNNRAYFSCANTVYYSDTLSPANMENAGQSLTVGDTTTITGLSGLPIQTTGSGVIAALLVFKSFQVWQILGDAAVTNTLSQNFLSLVVGCSSPRTIVQTPLGVIFIGIDGPYLVSQVGQIIPLSNNLTSGQQDINQPFQNTINPSRMAASFSGSLYRVSCIPTIPDDSIRKDYWFDFVTRRWSGPHTFGYDMASSYSDYFIISSQDRGAKLYASQYLPTPTSVYHDDNIPLTVVLTPSFLPKQSSPNVKQVVENTVELSAPTTSPTNSSMFSFDAYGETYDLLDTVSVTTRTSNLWGSIAEGGSGFLWGPISAGGSGALWRSSKVITGTYSIPWTIPLVFKKISVSVQATPGYGIKIGTIMFKYIETGYTNIQGDA